MSPILITALLLGASVEQEVDFDTEVLPILTKRGCNAAACHGAAAGRGGFRLSLFGSVPEEDHLEIVRRFEGRRINLTTPSESLFLLKPTSQVDHEGGLRFEFDGPQAKLLEIWIRQGARRAKLRKLKSLRLTPGGGVVGEVGERIVLRAEAVFDDGSRSDVTDLAVYRADDPSALEIDPNGEVTIHRRGRHHVIASYLDRVVLLEFIAPLSEAPVDLSDQLRFNWVDEEILAQLERLHVQPSPQAEDWTILRRLYLDLAGRLPTATEVSRYVEDSDSEKRGKLIDRLMNSDEMIEYWSFRLGKLLRIKAQPADATGATVFRDWVRDQLSAGTGWHRIASELLNSEGDTQQKGPPNFYLVTSDARKHAEYVSELFLGTRLRCANCHDHPLDRWTQNDYHGLAAIFAGVQRGRHVSIRARGDVIHPATGEPALPRIPGVRTLSNVVDPRRDFAEWLIADENPYFAKAMVNRIWKALMGRGLVEPTDDLRATNPASHPELLNRLATDFAKSGFDLRHTVRTIVSSAAYTRSARRLQSNASDDRYYSHALPRQLEAEVFVDAVSDATGVPEEFSEVPTTRAISLVGSHVPSRTLDLLGRCTTGGSCEGDTTTASALAAKLLLLNGPFLNAKIASPQGRLHRLVDSGAPDADIVEQLFLSTLSRPPQDQDRQRWRGLLDGSRDGRVERLEDFFWSLLSSREFRSK